MGSVINSGTIFLTLAKVLLTFQRTQRYLLSRNKKYSLGGSPGSVDGRKKNMMLTTNVHPIRTRRPLYLPGNHVAFQFEKKLHVLPFRFPSLDVFWGYGFGER